MKLIVFVGLLGLAVGCPSKSTLAPNLRDEEVDTSWVAAVFQITDFDNPDNSLAFRCLGAFVHEKGVLVSRACATDDLQDSLVVRLYDWKNNNNKILKDSSHQQQTLSNIIEFEDNYPGQEGENYINLLILSGPINLTKKAVMKKNFHSRSQVDYPLLGPTPKCAFVTSRNSDFSSEIELVIDDNKRIHVPECCTYYGYTIQDIISNVIDKTIDEQCRSGMAGITCYGSIEFYCWKPPFKPGPLVCDDVDGNQYLDGISYTSNKCLIQFANVDQNEWWITEQLNKI